MTRESARAFLDYRDRLLSFMKESGEHWGSSYSPGQKNLNSSFNRLAIDLFNLQFQHNRVYRTFCHSRQIEPSQITDWKQIPALPASAFKDLDVSSLTSEERIAVFHSSGTTQQRPSRHFHSAESLALYEESLLRGYDLGTRGENQEAAKMRSRVDIADEKIMFLVLTPRAKEAPHSSLAHMFQTIVSHCGSEESLFVGRVAENGSWTADWERTRRHLSRIESEKRPIIILGTASLWQQLLDFLEGAEYRLAPGSLALETGGFKGMARPMPRQVLYDLIHQKLQIPASHIISEYGMSELSSQAYDLRKSGENLETGVFRFSPWARVAIINPENEEIMDAPGSEGLIRIFDLANVWSVMAIQTEDIGEIRPGGFVLRGRKMKAEPRGCSLMSNGMESL